jgi:hypothetical protein
MKYKYAPTFGTKVPKWLEADWKRNAPAVLQSGSIERRALALSRMHKEKQIKPKILFQALALDFLWACLPEMPRPLPFEVEWVLVEALGLPPEHQAGRLHSDGLETRGRPDREALQMARMIEGLYQGEYNKPMPLHALHKEMKRAEFKTSRSVLRKWRNKRLRMPINTGLDFDSEWSNETLARWRAANTNARRVHVGVANPDRNGVLFGKAVIHPRSDWPSRCVRNNSDAKAARRQTA